MVARLKEYLELEPDIQTEVHLVGHSAGSIFLTGAPVFLARPGLGPNAARLGEITFGLLRRGGLEGERAVEALRVLLVYSLGFAAFWDASQVSRGKFMPFRCTTAGFTPLAFDGSGLRDLTRTRPAEAPRIQFLFVGSHLCSTLPSDPASRRRPCASLTLHLHQVE